MKRIGKYKIDFVIPLHKHNLLFPSVVEALVEYYTPRNIYIITSITEIEKLTPQISQWKTQKSHIQFIPEETFFEAKYSKKLETIKKWYTYRDEQSREFGWWYQQILKLGAVDRIPHLSSPFIIWDADLIPLEKWTLYPSFQIPHFHFALLQESEKNAFNQKQYRDSLFEILQLPEIRPSDRVSEIKSPSPSATDGTFVPHHFVFYPKIIRSFIKYLERIHHCTPETPWFRVILQLSDKYYRFSEYKIIATFMSYFYPRKLHYHPFIHYGKRGIRIRDSKEAQCFVQELKKTVPKILPIQPHTPCPTYISYRDFSHFMYFKYEDTPSYIQVEHLVG